MKPTIYVVINNELKMSPGKAAAQAVHAAMLIGKGPREIFTSEYERAVIVLAAQNSEQIKNLHIYLDEADIDCDYYIDEGVNEVGAFSVTALAAFVNDEKTAEIFKPFPLYQGHLTLCHPCADYFDLDSVVISGGTSVKSPRTFRALKKLENNG